MTEQDRADLLTFREKFRAGVIEQFRDSVRSGYGNPSTDLTSDADAAHDGTTTTTEGNER